MKLNTPPLLNNMQYFELDHVIRQGLYYEYFPQMTLKVITGTVICLIFYLLLYHAPATSDGFNGYVIAVSIRNPLRQGAYLISLQNYRIILTVVYISLYLILLRILIHHKRKYYRDYKFGKGVLETVVVTGIISTPLHNIYQVDSAVISTILSENQLQINQKVRVSYLLHCHKVLKVEILND